MKRGIWRSAHACSERAWRVSWEGAEVRFALAGVTVFVPTSPPPTSQVAEHSLS